MQKPLAEQSSQLIWISLVITVCLVVVWPVALLAIRDDSIRVIVSDIVFPLVNIIAAGPLFWAAAQSLANSRRIALAWGLIGLAQASLFTGDILWAVLEVGLKIAPFPSIADGFYLAYYPLVVAGLLLFSPQKASPEQNLQKALDMAIVSVSSILILWTVLIGPLLAAAPGETALTVQALTIAYPTGDLLILWTLTVLVGSQSSNHRDTPLILFTFAMLVMTITDISYSMGSIAGTYQSGGFQDIGWGIANLLTGLAGLTQALGCERKFMHRLIQLWKKTLPAAAAAIPYVCISTAFFMLVISYYSSNTNRFFWLALGVGGCIAMVIIRQVVTMRENYCLLAERDRALERVQQQAAALARSNEELSLEITERRRVEEQLIRGALYDALTALPNRLLLIDRIQRAIGRSARSPDSAFVLLLVDLDQFTIVNDSLGHLQGDYMLVESARRLTQMVRAADTVARLGADEFALLLEETDERGAATAIRRVHELFNQPFSLDGRQLVMTASIGAVTQTNQYNAAEEILRDANIARNHAKALGKAQSVVFNSEMRLKAINRLHMEDELRRAIASEAFRALYQPIFALDTGRLVGFEALIRWDHPARGLLAPGAFIATAEESGLILPIGHWILRQACRQLGVWKKEHPTHGSLTINVNISSKQLVQEGFVEQVEAVLRESSLPPAGLQLEITESVLLDNHDHTRSILARLHNLGVRIQIDDFGTGYSSLSYLQHYPIQGVKIDHSFLEGLDVQKKNIELLSTIVTMAHNLGLSATAEGVETQKQLALLKTLACPFAQGYLLAKPMDPASAEKYLVSQPVIKPIQRLIQPIPSSQPAD